MKQQPIKYISFTAALLKKSFKWPGYQKKCHFHCIIACEILQVQNVITLMLFFISYQQIMLSPYCDTSIRVSIIPSWVSIPGENEVAQTFFFRLQQLVTSRLLGRADFWATYGMFNL